MGFSPPWTLPLLRDREPTGFFAGVCVRARRGALPKVGDGAHVLEEGGVDDVVLVKLLEEF